MVRSVIERDIFCGCRGGERDGQLLVWLRRDGSGLFGAWWGWEKLGILEGRGWDEMSWDVDTIDCLLCTGEVEKGWVY